jgi:hypothetical protein
VGILEQPYAGDDRACRARELPRLGEADSDSHGPGRERPDDRDDLDDAREDADQDPVRQADCPEGEREHRGHERDQEHLAADVGAELEVDQLPRVPDDLPMPAGNEPEHEALGALTLEDPVRRRREHEEDPDQDLEAEDGRIERVRDDVARLRQPVEPAVDRHERVVLPAGLAARGGRDAVPADCCLHLVDRPRNDEPEQQADEAGERCVVDCDTEATGDPPALERLHSGAHRRGHDEGEEDERDQQLQLPEREYGHDHADRDEGGHAHALREFAHF